MKMRGREALKLRKFKREVSYGGVVPRGWRMAWYEPRRRVGVYYPAPLNWIVRAVREFNYRLRLALEAPGIEAAQFFAMQRAHYQRQRAADEYARGYMTGWRECFHACVEAIEDEMSHADEAWEVGALLTGGGKPPRPDN
jgi:hypothetical protein